MARIFITGSADGLGLLAARRLIEMGHQVVAHARNAQRARDTIGKISELEHIMIADLSELEETKKMAEEVNSLGRFDAVIHNAGVYHADNITVLSVNTLAPYVLTCLIQRPKRLVYLSSGLHMHGNPELHRMITGRVNYSDSKLQDVILAKAVARKWPEVYSNAVNPGWVPTKMGGAGAPDDLQKGFETQVWLAVSEEARISGRYLFHQKEARYLNKADNADLQDQFLEMCAQITGVRFPV